MAKPVPHDRAEASRRAAAMFRHWIRNDTEGVKVLIDEAERDGLSDESNWLARLNLICALLNVGTQMAEAGAHGEVEEYLDRVLRDASLDEVLAEGDAA